MAETSVGQPAINEITAEAATSKTIPAVRPAQEQSLAEELHLNRQAPVDPGGCSAA